MARGIEVRCEHAALVERNQVGRGRPGAGHRAGRSTGDVLMFAWMNREALQNGRNRRNIYWSRSRRKLWHKGEESGHVQKVLDPYASTATTTWYCSGSSRWAASPATPARSCFFQKFRRRSLGGRRTGFERPAGDLQMIDIEVLHRVSETLAARKK